MNLISCDNCGTVYDANKVKFPNLEDFHTNIVDGDILFSLYEDVAEWNGDKYVAKVNCKVCKHSILKPDSH
ncbi:hypothetical protein EBT31_02025 [bacterium]|nr:hypothetical protein [bacterium]